MSSLPASITTVFWGLNLLLPQASRFISAVPRHRALTHINKLYPCIRCHFDPIQLSLIFLEQPIVLAQNQVGSCQAFFSHSILLNAQAPTNSWSCCSCMLRHHILIVPQRIFSQRFYYFTFVCTQQFQSCHCPYLMGDPGHVRLRLVVHTARG